MRLWGVVTLLMGLAITPSLLIAVIYGWQGEASELEAAQAFGVALATALLLGGGLMAAGGGAQRQLNRREALLLVALSWTLGAGLAAIPFRLWAGLHTFTPGQEQAFGSYINCYFEAMSGLTTTGASILTNIESIPKSLLFWRAFTQWIGGLGIVVLFVAVLPLLGAGGRHLFQSESTGPSKEGVRPQMRSAAQALWIIYMVITLAHVVLLRLAGMDWLDAFSHSFASMATGGFSTQNASIGQFQSASIDWIFVFFMILAGANFGLYYRLITGEWRTVLRDPELRAYLGFLAGGALILVLLLWGHSLPTTDGRSVTGWGETIRQSAFQVVSIQTTTGFATADTDQWPSIAKQLLLLLMFVGACAGSTGGGVKVMRVLIVCKTVIAELQSVARPRLVRPVRIGRQVLDPQTRLGVLVYIAVLTALFLGGAGLIAGFEAQQGGVDAATALSASAATLNNIGPGFARVGTTVNYAWFTPASKLLMCALMALGRLELYAFLALLTPGFWRRD